MHVNFIPLSAALLVLKNVLIWANGDTRCLSITQAWIGVAFVSCIIEWSHYMFIFVQSDFESEIDKVQKWEKSVKDQGKDRDLRNQHERHKHRHLLCASQLLILPWEQRELLPLGWRKISGKEFDWPSLAACAQPLAWHGQGIMTIAGAQARLSALEDWCLLPGAKRTVWARRPPQLVPATVGVNLTFRSKWEDCSPGDLPLDKVRALGRGVFPWVWQDNATLLAGTGRLNSWILQLYSCEIKV